MLTTAIYVLVSGVIAPLRLLSPRLSPSQAVPVGITQTGG